MKPGMMRTNSLRANGLSVRFARLGLMLLLFTAIAAAFGAENPTAAFEQANKLYEQGRFSEAAATYEQLIHSGHPFPVVFYNLGNAFFKAGQYGRAIAAYRHAEKLMPRDPNLRFNLQFVRKKVSAGDAVPGTVWQRSLSHLTLNEWTALAAGAYWLWFLLLALREFRPALKRPLRGYTSTAGAAALLLAGCLVAAIYEQSRVTEAVVVAPGAVVRYGPLEESQVRFQLRDGSEIVVLDEKDLLVGDKKQSWLQVQDSVRGIGWLKRDQVVLLTPTVADSHSSGQSSKFKAQSSKKVPMNPIRQALAIQPAEGFESLEPGASSEL
jgi:tetratricopeptide (TPR) repeat protein